MFLAKREVRRTTANDPSHPRDGPRDVFVSGLGLIALAAGGSRSLNTYLVLSGLLFAIGMFGFLARRNAISMLMSIELMLNAVNLADRRVRRVHAAASGARRAVIALLVMAVAAAEATVGLAIVIAIYRNRRRRSSTSTTRCASDGRADVRRPRSPLIIALPLAGFLLTAARRAAARASAPSRPGRRDHRSPG